MWDHWPTKHIEPCGSAPELSNHHDIWFSGCTTATRTSCRPKDQKPHIPGPANLNDQRLCRAIFSWTRKLLWDKPRVKFGLLYPAKLRVTKKLLPQHYPKDLMPLWIRWHTLIKLGLFLTETHFAVLDAFLISCTFLDSPRKISLSSVWMLKRHSTGLNGCTYLQFCRNSVVSWTKLLYNNPLQ